jgi:hypothetical protein
MGNFEQYGFSGAAATEMRNRLRDLHPELFRLGDACARLGLDIAKLLPFAQASRQLAVSQFFARALSHFQAALLLVETGLVIESLSLSRSLLETYFVMGAIAENAVTPQELAGHDDAMRCGASMPMRSPHRNRFPWTRHSASSWKISRNALPTPRKSASTNSRDAPMRFRPTTFSTVTFPIARFTRTFPRWTTIW